MKQFPVFPIAEEENRRWKRLSLGSGVSLQNEDILGIFDMDTATVSPVTKKFLNKAQRRGEVSIAGDELPKSFVVAAERPRLTVGKKEQKSAETKVILSQFAPNTLVGRDGGFN